MIRKEEIDFVIMPLPRWDGLFSSTALAMARELSRTNRVFYIDNPFTAFDVIQGLNTPQVRKRLTSLLLGVSPYRLIDAGNERLVNVTPRMTLPINFLGPKAYSFFNRWNNNLVRLTISDLIRRFKVKHYILLNVYNPFYLSRPRVLSPLLSLYYSVDRIAESNYIKKHGPAYERLCFHEYDVSLVTSRNLMEYAKEHARQIYLLPNAVDFDLFSVSDSGPGSEQDAIGYIGHIDHRLDYALLDEVITSMPEYTFLFVGPISSKLFYDYQFDKKPNVATTGKKSIQELPEFIKRMKCTIIPFLRNELTKYIYPLKLNEYLASGKPVVSTDFSPDLEDFKNYISLADAAPAFTDAIRKEIDSNSRERCEARKNKAKDNTWTHRVWELWQMIGQNTNEEIV